MGGHESRQFLYIRSWSPLLSAASYSQLAGVLGGFLIAAIALLFDRSTREGVHTLALFSSAVLVLMLDAFLFSLMTGNQVPDQGDRQVICTITWTQGAVSTGMLAAGTTTLFGGLGWMLASHAVNKMPNEDLRDVRAFSSPCRPGGWLTFAAAMVTTMIVSETSIDYVEFVLGPTSDRWATVLFVTLGTAAMVADFVLVYVRTKALRTSSANTSKPTHLALRSIKVATVCTVILAVAASFLAVGLPRLPDDMLTSPGLGIIVVLTATFVLPTVISTAICYSVASTPTNDRRRIRPPVAAALSDRGSPT